MNRKNNPHNETSEDEIVDGPKAAAQILNRLPAQQREKLLSSMRKADPAIVQKIEGNVFTFDQVTELTDKSIQALIKQLDHNDLVLSLHNAKPEVQNTFFKNMTDRKKMLIQEDLANVGNVPPAQIQAARARACQTIEALRTAGIARTGKETGIWV